MTDSRTPDPPDPPIPPASGGGGGDDDGDDLYKRVSALLLLLPLAAMLPLFIQAVCRDVYRNPKHAADKHIGKNTSLKKICTIDGMVTVLDLWRRSALPGEQAFQISGLTPGPNLEPPTSTSMGEEARAASGFPAELAASITVESCIICRRRIVNGLVYFGYARKDRQSKSYRPVYATDELDRVVMEFISAIEPLIGDAADRLRALRDGGTDGEEGE